MAHRQAFTSTSNGGSPVN